MTVDMSLAIGYLPYLLAGAWATVQISLLSMLIGSALGFAVALLAIGDNRLGRALAFGFVWIVRGTPLLLQILLVYYWLPTIGLKLAPYPAGILTLSIGISAYYAEIFRAAIKAVPLGQAEAAYAVGMGSVQVMRRVVLPLAVRPVIPAYIGVSITLVKNTSLVSLISVNELMFTADSLYSSTYRVVEVLGTAGLLYLVLTSALQLVQMLVERRLGYYAVR